MQLSLWMNILLDLGNKFGTLFVFAYILTRVKSFRRIISKEQLKLQDRMVLAIIFGIFGIVGTYFSFEYKGALINTRLIGVAAGGLFGGPVVGLLSGLIAGVHRFFINSGSVTSTACAISTVFEGLMAGCMGLIFMNKKHKWRYALLTGVIGESMRKVALLIMVKPFSEALDLVLDIWVPMVVINSIGLAVFVTVLENTFRERERLQAKSAQLSLKIVDECLPYLRLGFDHKHFIKITDVIYDMTEFDAVTLTDCQYVLSHVGAETPTYEVGKPNVSSYIENALKTKDSIVTQNCKSTNDVQICDYPLNSSLTLPLRSDGEVIGTLKLHKLKENAISELDVELGEGLSRLIATELKISKLELTEKLLHKAEYNALQSQINPHFLFNSLTVIGSICRTDPSQARDLIFSLSKHFRKNLDNTNDLVSIHEEIEHVKAYVSIEKVRLNDDLEIIYDIPESIAFNIPPLTLQPLIENAIKHGIYPKRGKGTIVFTIKEGHDDILISIKDDGVGMAEDVKNEILVNELKRGDSYGTKNVIDRMKSIFGKHFDIKIISNNNQGTEVVFLIMKEGLHA